MAENSKPKAKQKGPGRPIQKGQVLNPGGRPKIPEDVKEMFRAASPKAAQALIALVESPDASEQGRIKACEIILNRAWGTPVQAIDVTSEGKAIVFPLAFADWDDAPAN